MPLNQHKNLILGSGSPRRKEILNLAGLKFEIRKSNAEEIIENNWDVEDIAAELAKLKADNIIPKIRNSEVLITADTIVKSGNKVMGKPKSREEALRYLELLSDQEHEVLSAYCLRNSSNIISCKTDITKVKLKELTKGEIDYYLDLNSYSDKAGAYGIQEWIGLIAIESIIGSYPNVMGLPIHLLWDDLVENKIISLA